MKYTIKIDEDAILPVYISTYYAISVLTRVAVTINSSPARLIAQYGTYLLIAVILLKTGKNIKNLMIYVALELVLGMSFLLSVTGGYIGSVKWWPYYKRCATTFIPLSVAAYNISNRKNLMKMLYAVSVIAIPVLALTSVFSYRTWEYSYDMSLGYLLVFAVLIVLSNYTIHARIYDLVLAAFGCVFILFVGSRGPFVCVMAFIVIELTISKQYSPKMKILILSVLALLTIAFVAFFDKILAFIYQYSVEFGFNSRSIWLLMRGDISNDSGRGEIRKHYIDLIKRNPIFGYGVMGKWISDSLYPHNLIVEMLLSFGCPLGAILLSALFFIMLKGARCKDPYNRAVAIAFISFCMFLLLSSTYLACWQFFVCIAICIPHKEKEKTATKSLKIVL